MSFSIKDKRIVLAGGESPVLSAVAERLASEGASLFILELGEDAPRLKDQARQLGVTWMACSAVDSAAVGNGIEAACRVLGDVDHLVFVAGRGDGHTSLENMDDGLWDRVVAENETAAFYCSRAVTPILEAQGHGSILYIASAAGISGAAGTAYASVAHGLISMCRNAAILFSGKGLRCNVLCPGPVDGMDWCTDAAAAKKDGFGKKLSAHVDGELPPVKASDVSAAVVFFLSDEAASINGQWLQIDRGYAC